MKRIIYIVAALLLVFNSNAQFTATMGGTTISTTGWSYPSAASTHDSVFQLTSTTGGVASYAKFDSVINMAGYCKFTANFDFQIIPSSGTSAADGIAFWFLNNPPPTGITGSQIGLPSTPTGLILIFDTYDNDGDRNNPLVTLLGYNGSVSSFVEGSTTGRLGPVLGPLTWIRDGGWHHVKVVYDAGNVSVYLNDSTTPSITGYYYLGIRGQFGFSSSTGGVTSRQSIKQVSIVASGCLTPINNGPLCMGDTLRLGAVGDSTGATYSWWGPGGFTSTLQYPIIPNVTYADSGIYYVVKTVAGVPDTASTIVTVNHTPSLTITSNSPVCYGTTLNLTALPDSVGETFSWTGPSGFSASVYNPTRTGFSYADTGVYTVIASLHGCRDTQSVRVTTIRVPVPVATNTSPTCIGYNVTLSASDSAAVSFRWTGPSGYSSTNATNTITSTTAGNAGIYTVVATIGTCTASATTAVTLSPMPPVPIIPVIRPVCSGNNLNLFVTDTAGATYNWTGPNGFTSTLQNPTINNIPTSGEGRYTVTATYGGCTAPPAYVYCYVDSTPALPAIAALTAPFCSNDTLFLTASDSTPGVRYFWEGPDTFSSTTQNPIIDSIQTYNSGVYTVTATLGNCRSSNTVAVIVNQTPDMPTVMATTPVCAGNLLSLSATATPSTGNWYWTGPNGFTSNVEFPAIFGVTVAASGTYYVYEDASGCISPTATVTVVVNPSPTIPKISTNNPVCEGDTIQLRGNNDSTGVSYYWEGPGGFTSSLQNPDILNAASANAGIYTLTASIGPCSKQNQSLVTVNAAPPLLVTSNSPVCTRDTLKFLGTSSPGTRYSWTGPYSFTAAGSAPFRAPAMLEYAGIYHVVATDINGCTSDTSLNISVNQTPLPPWVTWLTYCQYAYASPLIPIDGRNIQWYASASGGTSTSVAPIPSTTVPGVYFFYLSEIVSGCKSDIDSVQVIVYPKPNVTLTPNYTEICPHEVVVYTATDTGKFDTHRWVPSFYLPDSTTLSNVSTPANSIKYLLVTKNEFNCTDTQRAEIIVHPAAIVNIGAGDTVKLYPGQSLHFTPQSNGSAFTWLPNEGLDNNSILDPTVQPALGVKYVVTATTNFGCTAQDSVYVDVQEQSVIGVPNAFTPSGDYNKTFKINLSGIATLNHFRVFDRWGQLMFETKDINEGWDGSFSGKAQPFDVYIYDVQATVSGSGKIVNKTGNVTLIR